MPLFLVEHASGPFLIDTGYDPSISSDPTRTLGFFLGKVAMKHRLVDSSTREQVLSRGVDPAEISRVVMTHLHNDHTSGADQWPGATFITTREERDAAAGFGPYVKSHLATIESWQEIDYSSGEAEPFESRPKHNHQSRPPLISIDWTSGGHGLLGARPRSYQVTPDTPTGDERHSESQSGHTADSEKASQQQT